jgi:bacillithiol biosynthesis cysteine-adding enzyme BshC
MGSEDADLLELGRVFFMGKWFQWETSQTGAVGRMQVDDSLLFMINEMEKALTGDASGKKEIELFRKHYQVGKTIAAATFSLVHELFGEEGLLIFDADDSDCKRHCIELFRDELFQNKSNVLVKETIDSLLSIYPIQTSGRAINLFYLDDGMRSRIEQEGDCFIVQGSTLKFTKAEIEQLLITHPEKFSPNVILRPLVQEKLLPNVAFIGGGSELAYWMELMSTFNHFNVPFPVLILRNSFAIVSEEAMKKVAQLKLDVASLFKDKLELEHILLERNGISISNLNEEKAELQSIYEKMQTKATAQEKTLFNHVDALKNDALKRVIQLEKKMLRQEKKKQFSLLNDGQDCVKEFFTNGVLQERVENYFSLCIKYGGDLKKITNQHQQPFSKTFNILPIPAQ